MRAIGLNELSDFRLCVGIELARQDPQQGTMGPPIGFFLGNEGAKKFIGDSVGWVEVRRVQLFTNGVEAYTSDGSKVDLLLNMKSK